MLMDGKFLSFLPVLAFLLAGCSDLLQTDSSPTGVTQDSTNSQTCKKQSVMKRLSIIAGLALAMLCSIGCSKFEDIFNGNDKDVVTPVDGDVYQNFDISNFPNNFLHTVLSNAFGERLLPEDPSVNVDPFVLVVNDISILEEANESYYNSYGELISLPDIDFVKYSVVVGRFADATTHVVDQRIKIYEKN